MRCLRAAGIAALAVAWQCNAAWSATAVLPAVPRFQLSPGEYALHVRMYDEFELSPEAETMKLSFVRGDIVLELKGDPQVRFRGAGSADVVTLRFGDGEDDVVLRGLLTADDVLEGEFVVESYGYGGQHGTFTLVRRPSETEP